MIPNIFDNVFVWVILIVIVAFIVSEPINRKKLSDFMLVQNALKSSMRYNEKKQTLVVSSLSPYFKQYLHTEAYKESNYGYEEEKYVYTGATVGGVTMGEIRKTGGNYIEQVKTSKVQLVFYYYDPKSKSQFKEVKIVKKIKLEGEDLILKALKSPIRKYLNNNYIMVEDEVDEKGLKGALLLASQVGNMNMAGNFYSHATTKTMPTKEKCDAIIEWLSNCD